MIDFQDAEIKFAVDAVRQAVRIVRDVQLEMVTPALTKGDRSPVTVADFAAQTIVAKMLDDQFPGDVLIGEENADELRVPGSAATLEVITQFVGRYVKPVTSEQVCNWIDLGAADPTRRFWTLDPIDGTKGFLRGDQYAVAFALIVDGAVQIGVLGCPNLRDGCIPDFGGPGSLLIAVKDQGSWMLPLEGNGTHRRLEVSNQDKPAQARILRSFESGHTNVDQIDIFANKIGVQVEPVRMDSQAKYAVLAAGQGEYLLRLLSPKMPNYKEKVWDQAAGSLVVEEAGGMVTDLHGRPLDFTTGRTLSKNRGILASNSALHPIALEALRQIDA